MKHLLPGLFVAALTALQAASAAVIPSQNPPQCASWIEWNRDSERVVSAPDDADAAYPRAAQLSNGEILLAYHHGDGLGAYGATVTLRRSRDGGRTWYQTSDLDGPEEGAYWGFSNPDFIELGAGRMLLVSAARGKAEPGSGDEFVSECRRSALRLRFSDDYGVTWGAPRMILVGQGRLWEPAIVRLPDGELQIFYANESPDLKALGCGQSIESIRSEDSGQTWSLPVVVSRDRGCRNGMPAALALGDGKVVCAQEVVGSKTSPWIAYTAADRTDDYQVAQTGYEFGAAPFLIHAPDGTTLLAYHSRHRKSPPPQEIADSWMFSNIFIQHGDAKARNFGLASHPWPLIEPRTGAFFPSLMFLNDGTLVALASFITENPDNTTCTVVRWIEGKIIASPQLPGSSVVAVEESTDESESAGASSSRATDVEPLPADAQGAITGTGNH